MPHAEKEQLHLYLAGALVPAEREALEMHLADCPDCSLALATLAAEDAMLSDSLALDPAERSWIESVDLVEPVMARVAPRFRLTPPVIMTSLLILVAGYLAGSIWSAGSDLLITRANPGAIVEMLINLFPRLFRFVAWLLRGGVLPIIWPVLAMATLGGIRHLTRTKEMNDYA